jgi:hypothetical protein
MFVNNGRLGKPKMEHRGGSQLGQIRLARPLATFLVVGASAFCCASICRAQDLIQGAGPNGRVIVLGGDNAILETKEPRKDIPCTVTPGKPVLGFDLKFHATYDVSVPMHELNGGEDLLTMIFRVTPADRTDSPVYFSQKIDVPKLDEKVGGDAYLQGSFVLGPGNYQVDWLMRDRSERVCSSYWSYTAALLPKEHDIKLSIEPDRVEAMDPEPFRQEPPISREKNNGLNVKVLVNFAPQRFLAAAMQPVDTEALVSILRNISREPKIGKFSVVAFNMQEQRVVYRQDAADQIDFPAIGDSLNSVKLGTVRVGQLNQKHSDTEFLTQLITNEMAHDHPDAVIFAGPKVMMEQGVPTESVRALSGDLSYPVFYMNYNLNPVQSPWRDAIGDVVKRLRGFEYTISRPQDLWNAWSEIMSRIVKLKVARVATMPSATR